MISWMSARLMSLVFLLLVLTAIGLGLQRARAGSAAVTLAGQRATEAELALLKKQLKEDESFIERYAGLLASYAAFDFGKSAKGPEVKTLLLPAFYNTLTLAIWAAGFALLYGFALGQAGHIFPAVRNLIHRLNFLFLSHPIFIIALILLAIFALYLTWLPPGGAELPGWFLLPALALGLKAGSRLALFVDEFMQREKNNVYVLTHRAYGVTELRLKTVFIFKNLVLPVVSFWLLDFASYLAGAAVVETVFSIPGLGTLLLHSLFQYDLNLAMGILVFVSLLVFSVSIIQELLDSYFSRFSGFTDENESILSGGGS